MKLTSKKVVLMTSLCLSVSMAMGQLNWNSSVQNNGISGNNVGIGTTSPTGRLHIYRQQSTSLYPPTYDPFGIRLQTLETGTSTNHYWDINADASKLEFRYSTSTTTNPQAFLSPNGFSIMGNSLTVADRTQLSALTGTSDYFLAFNSKKVSPTTWQISNSANGSSSIYSDNNGNLNFYTVGIGGYLGLGLLNEANNHRMVVTNVGKVGIGTRTPAETLNVVGTSEHTGSSEFFLANGNAASVTQAIYARSTHDLTLATISLRAMANRAAEQAGSYSIGVEATSQGGETSYGVKSVGINGLKTNYGVHAEGDGENYAEKAYGVYASGDNAATIYGVYATTKPSGGGSVSTLNAYGVYGYANAWTGSGGHSTGNQYGIYGSTNPAATSINYAGYFDGKVYATSYHSPSDEKLKKDIKVYSNAIEDLKKLKIYSYNFIDDKPFMQLPKGMQYGFLAEELKQLFPQFVNTAYSPAQKDAEGNIIAEGTDFNAVNYMGFLPIAIKAIQEQYQIVEQQEEKITGLMAKNEELKAENKMLAQEIEAIKLLLKEKGILENIGTTLNTNVGENESLEQIRLEHNTPNPFEKSTTISFYLPKQYSQQGIQLNIYNTQGVLVRTYSVEQVGAGQIEVERGTLPAGQYFYSLAQNQKVLASKALIIQ